MPLPNPGGPQTTRVCALVLCTRVLAGEAALARVCSRPPDVADGGPVVTDGEPDVADGEPDVADGELVAEEDTDRDGVEVKWITSSCTSIPDCDDAISATLPVASHAVEPRL